MAKKRKAYAPFSLTSEAGVAQTPVEGYIDVDQIIYPTVNTGTINENGTWAGVKSNDKEFIGLSKAEGIADAGTVLFPDTNNHPSIDMEGFVDIQIAIKTSRIGGYALQFVFGPDTIRYSNLDPIATGQLVPFIGLSRVDQHSFDEVLNDSNQLLTPADAWQVFTILGRAKGQKNMQLLVTNNSGGNADIEFAFRRLV